MNDREYESLTQGWGHEGPWFNDCVPVCVYSTLRQLSLDMKVPKLHISYKVVRDELSLYHHLKGPSLVALRQNLDQRIQPLGFVVKEAKKPEMDVSRLAEIVNDDNCSFPAISVRWEYFKDQKVNYKKGSGEWDHTIVILEMDMKKQEVTLFDPMEKRLFTGNSMGNFKRRLPLPVVMTHWERARLDPSWALWIQKKTGQMKLAVN